MARGLAALALAASLGLVAPGAPDTAAVPADAARAAEAATPVDPTTQLHAAIEAAIHAHVPGAAGRDWVLGRVALTDAPSGAAQYIVATGVVAAPGARDTRVRLTGRYDPDGGGMDRVSYRLEPAGPAASDNATEWSLQRAVNYAFSQVLPDEEVAFALESAQASRVEGGGRRFEGAGIGTWADGEARFVSFAMTFSARGDLVEFDYSTPDEFAGAQDLPFVAEN